MTNDGAIGHENAPVMNSSNGNHGVFNMENGTKTAFFAFDPQSNIVLTLKNDAEPSEWGEHSFNDRYKFENATYLPRVLMGLRTWGLGSMDWLVQIVRMNSAMRLASTQFKAMTTSSRLVKA